MKRTKTARIKNEQKLHASKTNKYEKALFMTKSGKFQRKRNLTLPQKSEKKRFEPLVLSTGRGKKVSTAPFETCPLFRTPRSKRWEGEGSFERPVRNGEIVSNAPFETVGGGEKFRTPRSQLRNCSDAPFETLDLVEGVLLTPVSSGLDETAVQL
jgi:hypothetical protein